MRMYRLVSRAASSAQLRAAKASVAPSITTRSFASSVSADEVQKFDEMHYSWWDSTKNPLIHMNAVRVGYIKDKVQKYTWSEMKDQKVLDIGCGGGLLSESLARLGAQVTGVDPSEQLIKAAKAHSSLDRRFRGDESKLQFLNTTVEDLATRRADEQYDVICLLEVLEHLPESDSLLAAASRLMKPNGLMFVSTMSPTYQSYLVTVIGAEYVMGYLPVGTHDWKQYKSPQDVDSILKNHGFISLDDCGMVPKAQFSMSKAWEWTLDPHNTSVNWIGVYQKM